MIRIKDLSAPLDLPPRRSASLAARALGVGEKEIALCRIHRRSVDARRRDDVHFILALDVRLRGDEAAALRKACHIYENALA
ncbi:MAG: FAD-dependent oxidoreductase, partial [Clostridia bacterium]|nr:FAD-dependent oxidoreductase [Clostridia bacterium]